MSEKIGGAKGTELDNDFIEMEKVSPIHHAAGGFMQNCLDCLQTGAIYRL